MKNKEAQLMALEIRGGNTVVLNKTRRMLARVEKFTGNM